MSSLFHNKRRILRDGVDLNIQVREIIVHQILTNQIGQELAIGFNRWT